MEFVKTFIGSYAQALFMNLGTAAMIYFIVWIWLRKTFQRYRISSGNKDYSKQIKREIKNAFITFLIGALLASSVMVLSKFGYSKVYTNWNAYPAWWNVGVIFVFILIDETWFYWIHRLIHHPRLYKLIHFEHHKSIDVNPFTAVSFHVLESLLLSLWVVPVLLFIPTYAPAFIVLQFIGLFENIKSHIGYEFYPKWWNRSIFRFMTTSTYHQLHHTKFNGNYGKFFRIWDKILGTEMTIYKDAFAKNKENSANN